MKKLFLLFVLLLAAEKGISQNSSYEGWFWQYPKPQGNTLNDIFIFNQDTAIAVGDLGTFIKTIDGGKNWDVQHHAGNTSYDLFDVQFVDDMNGWAAGGVRDYQKNILLKTDDGGTHWVEVQTDTTLCYNAVYFVDTDTGFVVGEDGIVLRTTDGGSSWDTHKIDDYIGLGWLDVFGLYAIIFTDKQTGWIVGAGYYGNQIYKTTDCGRSWQWDEQIVLPKIYSGLFDICFIDKNNGFIVGDFGFFLKTTDGGTTWQSQNLFEKYEKEEYQFFYSTFFTDSLTGWIAGGDYFAFILKTTDGGENWIEEANNNTEMMHRFHKIRFSNSATENSGWIIGQFGMIYRTTDDGLNWNSLRDRNYYFTSIYFADENYGWAVGDSGIILHTTNGGDKWAIQYQNDSLSFSSVCAIDIQTGIVVGAFVKGNWKGIILQTTNSGEAWVKNPLDTLGGINSIFFLNDSLGWIAVSSGIVLRTSDKGNNWTQISTDLGTVLSHIQFITEDAGWVSFYGGRTLLNTLDGGVHWQPQFIDSNFSMYDFHFIDLNKSLTVGSFFGYNNIFRTIDGGENWEPSNNIPVSHYNGVQFANENIAWAVGGYGLTGRVESVIIKTTDGGNKWYKQVSPLMGELSKVYFLDENVGWSIGQGIIKTINGGGVVSVKDQKENRINIPKQIELFQNYPNPFNPTTIIYYQLTMNNYVTLKIYDILGQEVTTLIQEEQKAGMHKIEFDGPKYYLSSGVYFYTLNTGKVAETKKMILLR